MNPSELISDFLVKHGVNQQVADLFDIASNIILLLLLAFISYWTTKKLMVRLIEMVFKRSKNTWDDALVNNDFVQRLSYLVPIIVIYLSADFLMPRQALAPEFFKRLVMVLFVLAGLWMLDSILLAIREIYSKSQMASRRPIRGYLDAVKIIAYIMAAIFIVSILTGQSP